MDERSGEPQGYPGRGIGEILRAGFELYRRNWQKLLMIAAIVVVPLSLLQYFLQDRVLDQGRTLRETGQGVEISTDFWAVLASSLLLGLLTVLMYLVLTGAITRAVAGEAVGQETTVEESYRYGFARFGSIFLVGLLTALAVTAGFILFVIPGFFILTRLSVGIPALVVEHKRGTEALSRSWNLVKGHGWHVFGTLIVTWLLAGLVSSILTSPFVGTSWFVRSLASAVAWIITLPYTTVVTVLMYLDLRARKERLDRQTLQSELAAGGP